MKIGLGTAQFGLKYGISNFSGQTSSSEVRSILEYAQQQGIDLLDTAAGYGASEEILGQILNSNPNFRIVTKTPSLKGLTEERQIRQVMAKTFAASLDHLRTPQIYGLLVHSSSDLLGLFGEAVHEELLILKEKGLVKKIGISVYSGLEIDKITDRFKIDLAQVPLNIFDQRLIRSGHLKRLKKLDVEIHSRSVFLQGLLLMNLSDLPGGLAKLSPHLAEYHKDRVALNLSPVEAALSFALQSGEIDRILCGVNNRPQLEEIIKSSALSPGSDMLKFFAKFSLDDDELINPAKWALS